MGSEMCIRDSQEDTDAWFETATDPEIAKAVAEARAVANKPVGSSLDDATGASASKGSTSTSISTSVKAGAESDESPSRPELDMPQPVQQPAQYEPPQYEPQQFPMQQAQPPQMPNQYPQQP